jgi:hypothetical protein
MSTTDKSRSSTLNGDSTKRTPDRRFAYRKFVYSLLMGSVEDMKKGGKMERDAIQWMASESAGEILEDVDINRKNILSILKNILTKEGLEKKFYIKKLEQTFNEEFEECQGDQLSQ